MGYFRGGGGIRLVTFATFFKLRRNFGEANWIAERLIILKLFYISHMTISDMSFHKERLLKIDKEKVLISRVCPQLLQCFNTSHTVDRETLRKFERSMVSVADD